MKRSLTLSILGLSALALLAGGISAQTPVQAPKKADVVGTWRGNAVINDGESQIEIIVVVGKTEAGYNGKLSDTAGMIAETELRQIAFKDNKLTFEFDLAQGAGTTLIKIELLLDKETLKGLWFDPDGNSGAVELTLQK